MNTIVDCYAMYLARDWDDADGVVRVCSHMHKLTFDSMYSTYYGRENNVYAPGDKIPRERYVMIDFRQDKSVSSLMEKFEQDILHDDIYTDKSVIVFTLLDDDDGSMNYVEHWVKNHPEVSFIEIPEYLRRSEHPNEMFRTSYDFMKDRVNFVIANGVTYFFMELEIGKSQFEDCGDSVDSMPLVKRRCVEPHSPVARRIEVELNPHAVDTEKRVIGDAFRFVKHFNGHMELQSCASVSLLGKYLVCFNQVIPATPPIARGVRFDRETGEKEVFILPLSEITIENNVVVNHRKRPVDVNKHLLKSMFTRFLEVSEAEINGDVSMELQDFYILFHAFCKYECGFNLTSLHMHLWFFDACGEFKLWVVKRNDLFHVRCLHIDVRRTLKTFSTLGWNPHKTLARLEII